MMRRLSMAAVLSAAALVAAGCSNSSLDLAALSSGTSGLTSSAGTAAIGATTAAVGDSMSPEEIAASGPANPMSPFGDLTATPAGGREVIENPTLAEILAPASTLPEFSFGREDAPVVVVKYASLTCPFCRQFHAEVYPKLKAAYIDTGKVRFILRDFPIGRTSGQASVALRCVAPQKALDLYARFLNQQPKWVSQEVRPDAIHAIAAQVGLKRDAFEACRQDKQLVEGLKAIKDRGRKLGIIGTPNFFIGTKRIKKALDWPGLQAEIEPLLSGRAGIASATPSSSATPR
jgi:protein-disulfide isomerase